jgi:hypothetical protein
MKPFHMGWLREGEMPLNELPVRVNRIAFREYSRNPDLSDGEFRKVLGKTLFGSEKSEAVDDALFLNRCCFDGANWFIPPPLLAGARRQNRSKSKKGERNCHGYARSQRVTRARRTRRNASCTRLPLGSRSVGETAR